MVEKATEPWKVPEDSAHRKVTSDSLERDVW